MTLGELQQAFWRGARGELLPAELDRIFAGRGHRSGAERFRVYNAAYFLRLERCIAKSFPRTAELLGDQYAPLVRAYVVRHPSDAPAIELAGRHLPEYLRSSDAHARLTAERPLAAIAEVAALEWARDRALLAPDPERTATVAEVDPERFATASLSFTESLSVVRVSPRGLALWNPELQAHVPRDVAFFRKRFTVRHLVLDPDEATALEQSLAGAPLGQVCEAFTGNAVARALEVVGGWFRREWVGAIAYPEEARA